MTFPVRTASHHLQREKEEASWPGSEDDADFPTSMQVAKQTV
jgi:hypothetical protein